MHYIDFLPPTAKKEDILHVHQQRQEWVNQSKKGFLRYRLPCEVLQTFKAKHLDFSCDTVEIGARGEIHEEQHARLESALRDFMPWRKGPFSIFGVDIDSEWQSQRKWQRLIPYLPELQGKIIADIGCNNGYYMFRMLPLQPKLVLGLEPSVQHYYCFKGLNGMAGQENLHIDLLGVEHLPLFPECFDVLFLMGIIYHRSSPIDCLRDIFSSLRPGGTLVLESQVIPGTEEIAIFPQKTYAKVPGTYFVPTGSCLQNWVQRAGFKNSRIVCQHPMSDTEQRRTDWMQFESYTDFIDPANPGKTVEGYPAPERIYLLAEKK